MMKSIIRLKILLAFLLLPLIGKAYDFVDNGIQYTIESFTDLTVSATGIEDITMTSIEIPETVVFSGKELSIISIGESFAEGNESITQINILPDLKFIGSKAFYGCINLEGIRILGCKQIGFSAFENAQSLKEINLPIGLTSISSRTFRNCTSLINLTLPSTITTIEYEALAKCKNIESLTIPSSVSYIGRGVFLDCTSLREVIFDDSTMDISLLPSEIETYGSNGSDYSHGIYATFKDCPLKKLKIGRNILFYYTVGASRIEFFRKPFEGQNINDITITSSVTQLTDGLFHGCNLSGNLIIEDSLDSLNTGYDIYGAYSLGTTWYHRDSNFQEFQPTHIYIGRNISPADKNTTGYYEVDWEINGENLESYIVGGNCAEYPIVRNPSKLESLELGESVASIKASLCSNAINLKNIKIGHNITSIGSSAFSNCGSLSYFPFENIEVIGSQSFLNCSSLKEPNFENIISIEKEAFKGCDLIEEIILPYSLTSLSSSIIDLPLKTITLLNPEPPSCSQFPNSTYLNTILKIPAGSLSNYQNTSPWNSFWNIEELPDIKAEQIIMNLESVELNIGETLQLEATILPENSTDKTVTWNSSNEEVASVSEEGLVSAISAGVAIISVTCGEVSAECIITVLKDAGVESLLANPDSKISIYSTDGFLIRKDCKVEDLKTLNKGIYIIVSGKEHYKISI